MSHRLAHILSRVTRAGEGASLIDDDDDGGGGCLGDGGGGAGNGPRGKSLGKREGGFRHQHQS